MPHQRVRPEDAKIIQTTIAPGMLTNLKILNVRSLHHCHHWLWYDLRSTVTASLLLPVLIWVAMEALSPGDLEVLVGPHPRITRR